MDDLKDYTLTMADDPELLAVVAESIDAEHPDLAGADIALLFKHGAKAEWWGRARPANEELWLLSGGGRDIIVTLNFDLWAKSQLSPAGRRCLVDYVLSQVARKVDGKAGQERPEKGAKDRELFEPCKYPLGFDPAIIARNPKGYLELDELCKVREAMENPDQYLLNYGGGPTGSEQGADDLAGDDDGGADVVDIRRAARS
jgi:hypothetical protein